MYTYARKTRLFLTTISILLLTTILVNFYQPPTPGYAQTQEIRMIKPVAPDPEAVIPDHVLQADIPPPPYVPIDPPSGPIGEDTRERVGITSIFPYSAIGQLYITYPNVITRTQCTGWLFACDSEATYAVTAAHCLFDLLADPESIQPPGIPAIHVLVIPGQDINDQTGEIIAPFGLWESTQFFFDRDEEGRSQWKTSRSTAHDYVILKIQNQEGASLCEATGYFGFTKDAHIGDIMTLTGYPGDKTPDGSMWQDTGPIITATDTFLDYFIDTGGGTSGGPLWSFLTESKPFVSGIHVTVHYKDPISMEPIFNRAVRISDELFDVLIRYRQQHKIFLPMLSK